MEAVAHERVRDLTFGSPPRPGAIVTAASTTRLHPEVLVDRGHREIPIQPDFSGVSLETARMDHVIVRLKKTDGGDAVELVST